MIAGNTKIHTVYKKAVEISSLENTEGVLVYSWNPETRLPGVGEIEGVQAVGEFPTVLVEFDSGLKISVKKDFHFTAFRGDSIQALDLRPGMSVKAFSASIHRDGHWRIYGWANGRVQHRYIARLIWEYYHGKVPEGMIIHHKDFQEINNNLDNLELLSVADHNRVHYPFRKAKGFFKKNHKVVSISEGGYLPLYTFSVNNTGCFIIADDIPVAGDESGIVAFC